MLSLSKEEAKMVLDEFPKFELCYETIIHKKVYDSNVMLAIPDGQPGFMWFTNYIESNVCFFIDMNNNLSIIKTSFDDKLCLGTVLYGTKFNYNNVSCFCIEDIYYYRGKLSGNLNYLKKIEIMKEIFETNMSQIAIANSFTIFGCPLMSTDFTELLNQIQLLPYKVRQIKFRYFDNTKIKKIMTMNYFKPGTNNLSKMKMVFKVTADIEPDIYNLFIYKNGKEEYYDTAFIAQYEISKMMNKLFRNIKENDNLDLIEESDDEMDFEDIREDKYVYLDKSFKMVCEYNSKFKRWCPISLADKTDKIASLNIINNFLSNNTNK